MFSFSCPNSNNNNLSTPLSITSSSTSSSSSSNTLQSSTALVNINNNSTEECEKSGHTKSQCTIRKLGESLTCVVCSEIFIEASTLQCGHSFCLMCIETWLRRELTCPICRAAISLPPSRSLNLDQCVEILVQLAEDESQNFMERKKTCSLSRAREVEVEKAMTLLYAQVARAGARRLCSIEKPWSAREQNRFLKGIQHHQACAREAFCGLVGLTHEWVGRASGPQLITAAINVGLFKNNNGESIMPTPGIFQEQHSICKLRQRLDMFVRFG
jgi:hypothetical protein